VCQNVPQEATLSVTGLLWSQGGTLFLIALVGFLRARCGSRAAAWVVAATLVAGCAARWQGFVYPNYLSGVVFQLGALALWLVWAGDGPQERGRSAAVLLLAAWAGFSVASCLWAPERRLSAIAAVQVALWVGWALCVGRLVRSSDRRLVLRAIFLAGAIASLAGFYHVVSLGLYRVRQEGTPEGLGPWMAAVLERGLEGIEHVQGHRNFLAIFLLPPVLLGAAELWSRRRREEGPLALRPWMVMAGIGFMAVALGMCQSVGSAVGLAAGAATLAAMRLSRRAVVGLLSAGAVAVVCGMAALNVPALKARLLESPQATRWYMWQGTVRMMLDRPVAGWGTGTFMLRFADYKPTEPMRRGWLTARTLYPHNELLLMGVEGGVLGLVLYLAAVGAAVGLYLRRLKSHGAGPAGWAVLAGFVAMFAQGQVTIALRYWAPAAMYWTLLGLMLSPTEEAERRPGQEGGRWRPVLAWAGVLAAMWGVVVSGAQAEWLMSGGLREAGLRPEERVRRLAEAARLSRYVPDHLIALRLRAAQLQALGRRQEAVEVYEEMEHKAPGYGPVRKVLGGLYLKVAGQAESASLAREALGKAEGVLRRAVRQNPYDPEARLLLARALALGPEKDLRGALEQARRAVQLAPQSAEAHLLLGALLADAGRTQEALDRLKRAEELCGPDQQNLRSRVRRLMERVSREPTK